MIIQILLLGFFGIVVTLAGLLIGGLGTIILTILKGGIQEQDQQNN